MGFILIQINAPYIIREPAAAYEKQYYNITLSRDLQDFIETVYPKDPALIISICYVESGFKVNAYSKTNDMGLMQINKKYWNYYYSLDTSLIEKYDLPNDPYNPKTNIIVGINALNYWAKTSGSTTEMLSKYNQGHKAFQSNYANKILDYKKELERIKNAE